MDQVLEGTRVRPLCPVVQPTPANHLPSPTVHLVVWLSKPVLHTRAGTLLGPVRLLAVTVHHVKRACSVHYSAMKVSFILCLIWLAVAAPWLALGSDDVREPLFFAHGPPAARAHSDKTQCQMQEQYEELEYVSQEDDKDLAALASAMQEFLDVWLEEAERCRVLHACSSMFGR